MFHAVVVVVLRMLVAVNRCKLNRNNSEVFNLKTIIIVLVVCCLSLGTTQYLRNITDEFVLSKIHGFKAEVY